MSVKAADAFAGLGLGKSGGTIVSSDYATRNAGIAAMNAGAGAGGFTDSQNAARIIINVNGAIDKEGTARTIVDTLNDSYYRGTGGATALQAI